jgi:CDP-diacylglycerol--serine O-phosphatidyltransferase
MAGKHFSMIRDFHLADIFTVANGFCGVAALFQAMRYLDTGERGRLDVAAALVILALLCDVLDGRIARWRHKASALGRELDSLADVISFGVAPAGIAFAAGLESALDQIVLMYFVGCGVSRLARYNVTAESLAGDTGKVPYFEGTPIPTSIVPLALLLLVRQPDDQQDPPDPEALTPDRRAGPARPPDPGARALPDGAARRDCVRAAIVKS